MKFIFRYTILAHFPHPDNKITQQQLQEALGSVKFELDKYDLNFLESLCVNCIQKILTKPQQKVINVIEDVFVSNETKKVPQFNPKQLQTIWQQQKVNVYKSILHSSCQSAYTYKDMQWSVKNIIMRRSQSLSKGNNLITRLNINCLQNPSSNSNKTSLIINMNKQGVQKMYNSLVDCQNAINQVLLSEE